MSSHPNHRRQSIKAVSWTNEGGTAPDEFGTFETIVDQEAQDGVDRLMRLVESASRPKQSEFRAKLRDAYQDKCAVTGCGIAGILEAAHVRVEEGKDINHYTNGILLRADIHALFDLGLLTLALDGSRLELGADLKDDPTYGHLENAPIFKPQRGGPSPENIGHHRLRFGFDCPVDADE